MCSKRTSFARRSYKCTHMLIIISANSKCKIVVASSAASSRVTSKGLKLHLDRDVTIRLNESTLLK